MGFNEKEIRAVRTVRLESGQYWVHAELFIDGKWKEPFLVDEVNLHWYNPRKIMYTEEYMMKNYIKGVLRTINEHLSNGYKLVDKEKFDEVIDRYHFPDKYQKDIVYL